MWQSIPKRRHIKYKRREIIQKKAYNIQNTAKVWNQGFSLPFFIVNVISFIPDFLLCFCLSIPLFIKDGLLPTAEPMFCKAVEVVNSNIYSWLCIFRYFSYFFPFSIHLHFNSSTRRASKRRGRFTTVSWSPLYVHHCFFFRTKLVVFISVFRLWI